MNWYWLVTGLLCLCASLLRSVAFFTYIAPSDEQLGVPSLAWFYTAWFIVSGLFLICGAVFIVLSFKYRELAAIQIATLLVSILVMAAIVVLAINFLLFSYYNFEPIVVIGLIVFFSVLGIRKHLNEAGIQHAG